MNDHRILNAGVCFTFAIILLAGSSFILAINLIASACLLALMVIMSVLGTYLVVEDAKDNEMNRKAIEASLDPEIMRMRLENEAARLWRGMTAQERADWKGMRVPLLIAPGINGPDEIFDLDGVKIPRQFVIYYFTCSTKDYLAATGDWSDGQLWDVGNPNSPTMRFLAENTKRYLALKGLVAPSAGPQRAQVYDWQKIADYMGLTMEEIDK